MRLSEKEQRIIYFTELNANITLPKLQRLTGYRTHTLRYALHRLEERGIIKKTSFIDVYPLGFTDYSIYFSLTIEDKKIKDAVIKKFITSPLVSWLAGLGGDFQYGAALYARHISVVSNFLDEITSEFGNIFFQKSINIRNSFTHFQRKYLISSPKESASVSFGDATHHINIDKTDHKILHYLVNKTYDSYNEVAHRLNIPFSTLTYRLKKLEQNRVITGHTYQVDASLYGMQMFEVLIYAKGITKNLRNEIFNFSKTHPNIVYFLHCIGEWDFELGVEMENAEEINGVVEELYERFGKDLVTVKILPLFRSLKLSWYPF